MENVKNQLFLDPSNIWITFDHKGVILRGINTFMDDGTIKVLSWIGISSMATYRYYFLKERSDKTTLTKITTKDKETLTDRTTNDKGTFTEWKTHNKETSTEWKGPTDFNTYMRELFEPGQPSACEVTKEKIELLWDVPNVGVQFVQHYKVHCINIHNSSHICYTTQGNCCNYTVKNLKPDTEYEFKIQTIKNNGNEGPCSISFKKSTHPDLRYY